MRIVGKRWIAAAAVSVVTCMAGPVVSASASIPVLHASQDQVAHVCTVIGSAPYKGVTYQGVVCVTIFSEIDLDGSPGVVAQLEAVCQTPSGNEVQCAEIHAIGTLANAATGPDGNMVSYSGHAFGPCPAGRYYMAVGLGYYTGITASNCQTSLSSNIWALAYGSGTGIELPGSGQWVYLSSSTGNDAGNESTGHYYICP